MTKSDLPLYVCWLRLCSAFYLTALVVCCVGNGQEGSKGDEAQLPAYKRSVKLGLDGCSGQLATEGAVSYRLNSGARWTAGKSGCAVEFDGISGSVNLQGALVQTDQSFSVSSWLTLDSDVAPAVAITQQGSVTNAFGLLYTGPDAQGNSGRLAFSLAAQDNADAAQTTLISPMAIPLHTWTHVVASYDAEQKIARLYLNGQQVAHGAAPQVFSATGSTYLGSDVMRIAKPRPWPGKIDEVNFIAHSVSPEEVTQLHRMMPSQFPIRAPATPLITRGPYTSAWLASDSPVGDWPRFYSGLIKAITLMARVDGQSFVIMGAPLASSAKAATLAQLEVTPNQTKMSFVVAGANLYVVFSSLFDPQDLRQLSVPLGTLSLQAQSNDGQLHDIELYADISGEWAHGVLSAPITWQYVTLATAQDSLLAYSIQPNSPNNLNEVANNASWGHQVWAAGGKNVSFQSGPDVQVRGQFNGYGGLTNLNDFNQPRAINDTWPVFAFAFSLPQTTGTLTAQKTLVFGHVEEPAISYQKSAMAPLWRSFWGDWQQMVMDVYAQLPSSLARAEALDGKILADAVSVGGHEYAALCALTYRQGVGPVMLTHTVKEPWLVLKDTSRGDAQAADMMYASMPLWLYIKPDLLRFALEPIFAYVESGLWPQDFAPHNLGAYPNLAADNDGGGNNTPIESTASMLLMSAAYVKAANDANASSFVSRHYPMLAQWANYLVDNTLDTQNQAFSDTFAGPVPHSVNLALKGILAVKAMSQLAMRNNKTTDAVRMTAVAQNYITRWRVMAGGLTDEPLRLAYDQPGTWSMKYNMYIDKLLGLNLLSTDLIAAESAFYGKQMGAFGLPLDQRHLYTRVDWQLWAAGFVSTPQLKMQLINAVYLYANKTTVRAPLADLYHVTTADVVDFQAWPAVGGLYALLAMPKD